MRSKSGSIPAEANLSHVTVVQSGLAAIRLREARKFLSEFDPGVEVLILGASRGSVDDLARAISLERGATFGLHRFSLTQLAARLALIELASHDSAPTTVLGHEAVATRAAFESRADDALQYFSPVSQSPGFPKALARTLLELRLAAVVNRDLVRLPRSGSDLAALLDRVDTLLHEAGGSDRAALFEIATRALHGRTSGWLPMPALLLDVPFASEVESQFLCTLLQQAPLALVVVPAGDISALNRLEKFGVNVRALDAGEPNDLTQLSNYLFSREPPPERTRTGELVWFSAPGESREAIEIARRILQEAGRGVPFDEIAIVIRPAPHYVGLLEHALERAGISAYFDRGIRRPDPAGRAFLAILSCAAENFSAKRFAEYLSLGQVPLLAAGGNGPANAARSFWLSSGDEVFGIHSERAPHESDRSNGDERELSTVSIHDDDAVLDGTLRAPWKWESLLVESAVIGGAERWARRLSGLAAEYELKIRELATDQPDSPRIAGLERERKNLVHLQSFALPLIEQLSAWPKQAAWGDWLQRLEELAPRVLRRSEDVLRVLADLRPMAEVGPVGLPEVRDVLVDRLGSLEIEPPVDRYGRVFVCSPDQVRGRAFRVVFVPGLAERLFPQKLHEDPLLLDELRLQIGSQLLLQQDRAEYERLLLRLSVGAATERLYLSFPRIETAEARARVRLGRIIPLIDTPRRGS